MFNSGKIKKLEEDISFLYKLYENLHEKTESDKTFETFCTNKGKYSIYMHPYSQTPEPEWQDITVKTVVDMILKKMGLEVEYIPGKVEVRVEIPSEFKLVKKE